MFKRNSKDYTVREWAEALDVHVETIREHAKRRGLCCKPGQFRMHSFEEQAAREARVQNLRDRIRQACMERPDPPPRRADVARMTETAKQRSPRLRHTPQIGQGIDPMEWARRAWR